MTYISKRTALDLYRNGILNIETHEILAMYTWVVENRSSEISIWDWTPEIEAEFKLRFL